MDVFEMKFAKVYPMLIAKAERKGRTADEVYEVTCWLTGYTKEDLKELLNGDSTYGEFLDRAPRMNPDRFEVKGKICGVRIEEIEDPRMRDLRILDKLVDDLAKGIDWILNVADREALSAEAVKKVRHHYATQQVMVRYIEVYQQALAQKHLKL